MAERTGLEPATPGVTGRYSNQLNYRSGWGGESYPIGEYAFKLILTAEGAVCGSLASSSSSAHSDI